MIHIYWGYFHRERREDSGQFECPRCMAVAGYDVYRTYRYCHFCFIPLGKELAAEVVRCTACGARHPVMVLADGASRVSSSFEAGQAAGTAVSENVGNVVALTKAAASEIVRRLHAGQFGPDAVVRIPPGECPAEYTVAFDYALADGRDWIGASQGIPIVVDRRAAPFLLGKTIDFREGAFCDGRVGES
jgi:Fe-S cluster assembly iron-binding protein IscA